LLGRREFYIFHPEYRRIREGKEGRDETLFTGPSAVDIPGIVNPHEEVNGVRASGRILAPGLDNLHLDGCSPGRRGGNKENKQQYKTNQQAFHYI